VVALSVLITYALWIGVMWKANDCFGILLVLVVIHASIAVGEITRYPTLAVWHGTWVVAGLAAYAYIRFCYRFFGPHMTTPRNPSRSFPR